jgi:hypothetical protein
MPKEQSKSVLYGKGIFIPVFWQDTQMRGLDGFEVEKDITARLWPLPVDHRYDVHDMEYLFSTIKSDVLNVVD